MNILKFISRFFSLGVIFPLPAGLTADKTGMWGLMGLMNNVNNYSEALTALINTATAPTLTTTQALIGITQLGSGASGGFNVTLPTSVAIIAALGPSVPTDGSYSEPISIMNNGAAQTATLVAGDVNTSTVGSMTIATGTRRLFMLNVLSNSSLSITNIGTIGL